MAETEFNSNIPNVFHFYLKLHCFSDKAAKEPEKNFFFASNEVSLPFDTKK